MAENQAGTRLKMGLRLQLVVKWGLRSGIEAKVGGWIYVQVGAEIEADFEIEVRLGLRLKLSL